jgi:FkbM family methyltransferase
MASSYKGIRKLEKISRPAEIDSQILSGLGFGVAECQKRGVFIFGVGKLGQIIYRFCSTNNIPVLGFVDNNEKFHEQKLNGIQVFRPNKLKNDSIVYIASETYLNPIRKQLSNAGIELVLSHFQGSILFKSYPDFPVNMFCKDITEDIFNNKELYLKVFSLLGDDSSKIVFDNLIHYRMTANIAYIDEIASASNLEYFDANIITLDDSEVFLDCGAFDGDSAWNFITNTQGKFKSIHLFEPDKQLLNKARARLKSFKNIHYNEVGIFNKTTTQYFDNTGGLDGSITDSGNIEIKTLALDEYQSTDVPTYFKFDIEGAEIEALHGARNLISRYTPKLAIACYHYPWHLWNIPMQVLEINQKYNMHLRHYSDCIFGSTYYFLPH